MVPSSSEEKLRASALSLLAMTAFAANSILCRLALVEGDIDAVSFTLVRLLAGAIVLWLLARRFSERGKNVRPEGDWPAALMLFIYAAAFSFAYVGLTAATGALILFGAVQLTMILGGLAAGERPLPGDWWGFLLASGGLGYLLLPGLEAPPLHAALLMALSGAAWGIYSLRGRRANDPLLSTAGNFIRSIPFALLLAGLFVPRLHLSGEGLLLAVASGALASGIGYVVWYAALRGLTATRAAAVQLSVPVLSAAGGFIFLAEPLTFRWLVSASAVLGGISLTFLHRHT